MFNKFFKILKNQKIILFFIFIIFILYKISRLTEFSLTGDELFSIEFINLYSFKEIIFLRKIDPGNPSLFFIFLKLWALFFSQNEFLLKLFPLLLFIVGFLLCFKKFKKVISLTKFNEKQKKYFLIFLFFLILFSAVINDINQYVRPYILILIFIFLEICYLIQLINNNWNGNQYTKLVIVNVLGLYTHHLYIFFNISLLLSLFVFYLNEYVFSEITLPNFFKMYNLKKIVYFFASSFIFYLPWISIFLYTQLSPQETSIGWKYSFWQLDNNYLNYRKVVNIFFNFIFRDFLLWDKIYLLIIIIVLVFSYILVFNYNKTKKISIIFLINFFNIFLYLFTPVKLILVKDVYLAFAIIPFYLTLACSFVFFLDVIKYKKLGLFFIIFLLICYLRNWDYYHFSQENFRFAANYINQQNNLNNLVFVSPEYTINYFDFYKKVTFYQLKEFDNVVDQCSYKDIYLVLLYTPCPKNLEQYIVQQFHHDTFNFIRLRI